MANKLGTGGPIDPATLQAMVDFGLFNSSIRVPSAEAAAAAPAYGGLDAYDPTLRDRVAGWLMDRGLPPSTVEGLVGSTGAGMSGPLMGAGLVDVLPGVNVPFAVDEYARAEGPDKSLAAIGLVPGAKPTTRMIERGVKQVTRGLERELPKGVAEIRMKPGSSGTFEAIGEDGERVGEMMLANDRAAPYASYVSVEPGFRRGGVATALYDFAEEAIGRPMVPSPLGLSKEATKFWRRRLSDMPPADRNALLQESLAMGRAHGIGRSAKERLDDIMPGYDYGEPSPAVQRGQNILTMLRSGRSREITDDMLDMGDAVENAKLGDYLYRNYDLPMDEGSRAARSERFGGTLYHGSEKGGDFSRLRPFTFLTENTDEASAYTAWREGAKKQEILSRPKYVVEAGRKPSSDFVEYSGILSDIQNPKVGQTYATDQGVFTKAERGWIAHPDLEVEYGPGSRFEYTPNGGMKTGIRPGDGKEAVQTAQEWRDFINERYSSAEGASVTPVRTAAARPREMSALAINRVGERLGGDASMRAELLKSGGPDVVQTASDEATVFPEVREAWGGIPYQEVVIDPVAARSPWARFDPRLAHLRNLSAGVAGAAALGGGMMYDPASAEAYTFPDGSTLPIRYLTGGGV